MSTTINQDPEDLPTLMAKLRAARRLASLVGASSAVFYAAIFDTEGRQLRVALVRDIDAALSAAEINRDASPALRCLERVNEGIKAGWIPSPEAG
jgi:hypothetical protein